MKMSGGVGDREKVLGKCGIEHLLYRSVRFVEPTLIPC